MVVTAGLVVVALVAVAGWVALRGGVVPFLGDDQCSADVGGHSVILEPSQARTPG